MLESSHSISEIRAKLYDLGDAWGKCGLQFFRVMAIAGRGRLVGLEDCHYALERRYYGTRKMVVSALTKLKKEEEFEQKTKAAKTIQQAWRRKRVLKEEQIQRNLLEKVVLIGEGVAELESSILDETKAKDEEEPAEMASQCELLTAEIFHPYVWREPISGKDDQVQPMGSRVLAKDLWSWMLGPGRAADAAAASCLGVVNLAGR